VKGGGGKGDNPVTVGSVGKWKGFSSGFSFSTRNQPESILIFFLNVCFVFFWFKTGRDICPFSIHVRFRNKLGEKEN